MATTVYSKPNCPQCSATKRRLDKRGVKYDVVDVTVDEAALNMVMDMGFQQAPVVISDEAGAWSGYRPDKIDELTVDQR